MHARGDVLRLVQLDSGEGLGWQLLYLALVPTAFAGWLQAWGQAHVRAHEAVIIYTLDPVYGALFAWLLLGETLHTQGYLGCAVVLCANLLRQVPWEQWKMTEGLVTPSPSEAILRTWSDKAVPLLPTR